MARPTITLDNDLHRALKETAARQGRSIASIIEESLRLRGIQDQASARALVEAHAGSAHVTGDHLLLKNSLEGHFVISPRTRIENFASSAGWAD